MASALPITARRTAAAFHATTLKAPTRQTLSATSVFQRGGPSSASRGLSLLSRKRDSTTATGFCSSRIQVPNTPRFAQQVRWNSDESGTGLREWGFEEINASLPSTSNTSPSHNPVILIDVREPVELTGTGIIPTAISIPLASQPDALYLTEDEFETRFGFPKPQVDGAGKLVFYCKAGVRARAAAQLAVQAGYDPETVGVYEGSWIDWEKHGGRVERWDGDD